MNLFCVVILLLMSPVSSYAGQSENCSLATKLVTQAYDKGHSPEVYAEQKRLLNQALQLCPDHPEAHNNLASIFEQEKNYDQALVHYRKALQAKPDFAQAWFGIGETYYKTGRFPLSLEAYLRACKTDKDAREKIRELLNSGRYKVSEEGEISYKDSLLLIFDKKRRDEIKSMIADCGFKADVAPVFVFRNILFDTGSAALKPESSAQLKEISDALKEAGNISVIIGGHTDRKPFKGKSQEESDNLNLRLSKERADSVARQLTKSGVTSDRIQTKGYGVTLPEISGDTPQAYVKNRRVTIEVAETTK